MKTVKPALDTSLEEVDDTEDIVYEYNLMPTAPDLYASGKMQAMQEAMDIDTGVDTRTKRERINEQMDALKSIGRGSITSPVTGVVDTVEAGKMLPELDDKVKPFAPTYTGIESAFEQLYNLGFNRKTAEKAIKDVTGIELKGDTGELIGEFISPVAATKAVNAIASSATKYGTTEAPKAISRISAEAKKLFSDAGGFDDLATATAGSTRGQTAKMLDKRPLPDTSVTKIIIGQSGKDYDKKVASYNKAKQQLIPGKNRVDDQDAQELWNRTGAQEDVVDNDIVYEIPTAKARLKLEESDLFDFDAPSPSLKEGRASFGAKFSLGDERVITLNDILDFDELYKQAPYLKNVQVKRLNGFARIAGTKAAYNPESNTIFIASGSPTNLTSDLLHEVEHAVQAADGKDFGGGNFRRILKEDPEYDMLGGAERKRKLNKTRQDIITEYSNKDSLKKEHIRGFLTTFPNVPNPKKFIDTVRALPAVEKTGRAAYADVFPYYTDVDNFMQNQFSEINYEYTSSIIDALNFIRTASPKQITSLLSDIKNAKLMDLEKFDAVEKRAVLKYLRDPGEVTARNVQFRFLTSKKDPSITSVAPRLTEDRYAGLGEVPFDVVNKPPTKAVDQLSREAAEKGVSLTDEGYYLGTAAERGSEAQSLVKNTDTMTAAGLTQKDVDAWRKANETNEEFRKRLKGRSETLQSLAKGLKDKDITVKEYREAADAIRPIRRVTDIPRPATTKEIVSALGGREGGRGIVGLNRSIPDGEEISARLDINAYTNFNVWIPTLTYQKKNLYSPSVSLRNVKFIQPDSTAVNKALKVATGSEKNPFAVMTGNYNKMSDSDAFDYAKQVFDDDEWIQIGYDPTRRGYFYDRADGAPVLEAEEVVQIGHLVLAKKARKGNPEDFTFAKGGLMARR